MTTSILQTLAALPSGNYGPSLDTQELGHYLGIQLNTEHEKERNRRHVLRDELYRDGGCEHMKSVIDLIFKDEDVRALRKALIPYARFASPLKRIVNELSTVYAEPAERTVTNNEPYKSILDEVRMDESMFQVGRLVNLHRSLLVGFRVKDRVDGESVPVIDIATPAHARAILHPNDPSEVVGWLIANSYRPARHMLDVPSWTLWSAHERMHLRSDLSVIPGSLVVHELGVCPWVPVTLGPPGSGFWPGEEGEDLVAAAVAGWLAEIFGLKEMKSATKQAVISGDTTSLARGQAADSETPVELGDGSAISTIDNSMDLSMFRDTGDHILERTAGNYGMSAALITHQGVQSAEARELMRVPLRELRLQQQTPLRRFEERFAKVMAAVLAKDLPSRAFNPDGWRIQFGEAQTPLSGNQEVDLFIKKRAAGLDCTAAFIQRQHPGMTLDQAEALMVDNIVAEVKRNELMRPLMAISGSMGAETPDDSDEDEESEDESQDSTAPEMFGRKSAKDDKEP